MFVAVNSGSLPPELLESTLFGHVKGAFTSAIQTKKGYFEVADRGTIFFDEIGTLGPETQIKLLRVIQEKEFTPLGSTDPITGGRAHPGGDQRGPGAVGERRQIPRGPVLPAERDQYRAAAAARPQGRHSRRWLSHFFTITAGRTRSFWNSAGKSVLQFQPDAMQVLMEHNWPGNVRELENVVERAVVLASDASVPVDVLPDALLQAQRGAFEPRESGSPLPADASLFEIVNGFERRTIIERLEKCSWSQTEAAETLHVPFRR